MVEEFGGSIWPTGPRQRGNGVDHHPQWVSRFLPYSVSVCVCVGVHTLSSFRQSAHEALLSTLHTIPNWVMLCRPCCTIGALIIPELEKLSGARGALHPPCLCPDCQRSPATRGRYDKQGRQRYACRLCIVTLPLPLEKEEPALELVCTPAPCLRRPLTPPPSCRLSSHPDTENDVG